MRFANLRAIERGTRRDPMAIALVKAPCRQTALPARMALYPSRATSAALAACRNIAEPDSMEAADSKPVAVGPGQSAVTVTQVPDSSSEKCCGSRRRPP